MFKRHAHLLAASLVAASAVPAVWAAPIDFGTWSAESYPAVSGFNPGVWTVAAGGGSVTQSVNGQPTIYYSDFNAFGTQVEGTIRVNSNNDDDFIGFVLGFDPGDSTSTSADYLLVDWKRNSQNYDFGPPSSSGVGNAPAGLAVSRVFGTPDADEFWQHANLAGTAATSGLDEIARADTLGATGWNVATDYTFTFDFGPGNLDVYVNGVLQFALTGSFANGRMGFYNFSQADVTYAAFDVQPGTFGVPEPRVVLLLGLGLAALGWQRRPRMPTVRG